MTGNSEFKTYNVGEVNNIVTTTPQLQLGYADDYVTKLFDSVEYLTKKLEPVLLPQDQAGVGDTAVKGQEKIRESDLVMRIGSLNDRLWILLRLIDALPNYIQL